MRWLKAAIARLSGRSPTASPAVPPMRTAGPASLEPIQPLGSSSSALPTNSQPANPPVSPSSEPARSTTLELKLGEKIQPASRHTDRSLTAGGSKSAAPAPRSRQPAKPAAKPKRKPASKTKAAAKRTPGKAPAQTRTARPSGARGN